MKFFVVIYAFEEGSLRIKLYKSCQHVQFVLFQLYY